MTLQRFLCATFVFFLLPGQVLGASFAPEQQMDALQYAVDSGILYANEDDMNFSYVGSSPISRLEFTLAVTNTLYPQSLNSDCMKDIASSLPVRFTKLFGDVPRDIWYGRQLCVAIRAGIIHGDHEGNFRPFNAISAAEAATILSQAYGLTYPARMPSGKPWYWGSMEALRKRDAIDSSVKPSQLLTGAGVARMFYALQNTERFPESRIISRMDRTPTAAPTPSIVVTAATVAVVVPSMSFPGEARTINAPKRPVLQLKKSHRLLKQEILQSRGMGGGCGGA
jgi:hypothetical protein